MSSGFAGESTRSMSDFEREIETRTKLAAEARKRLDTFTDDYNPPGAVETVPGEARDKPGASGGYGKPHEDTIPEADRSFTLAAVGREKDQKPLDDLDKTVQEFEARIKKPDEQFPGKILSRMAAGVDEALWNKGKEVSQAAFDRIKWNFVNWYYSKHGGK